LVRSSHLSLYPSYFSQSHGLSLSCSVSLCISWLEDSKGRTRKKEKGKERREGKRQRKRRRNKDRVSHSLSSSLNFSLAITISGLRQKEEEKEIKQGRIR